MDDLCTACLSTGRNLYLIGETGFYEIYTQILNEIPAYELSEICVRVCWECRAALRRLRAFRRAVRAAHQRLRDYLHQTAISMAPTTRKTHTEELEVKLRATLKDLLESRKLCDKLLSERDESEVEVQHIITRNTHLKKELAQLDLQYQELLEQHDRLQDVVNMSDKCRENHECALNRIKDLEYELADANKQINCLQKTQKNKESQHTMSLFNELVENRQSGIMTIDLTSEKDESIHIRGSNKIKKYIKCKRVIKKSINKINKIKKCVTSLPLKRKQNLYKKIQLYGDTLYKNNELLENNSQILQLKVKDLESSLEKISSLYSSAQQEISEHIAAMNTLIELGNYNMERFDSLTCSTSNMDHVTDIPPESQPVVISSAIGSQGKQCQKTPYPSTVPPSKTPCAAPNEQHSYEHELQESAQDDNHCRKTLLFTDQVGVGFGKMLNNCLRQQVTNVCMPGATFSQIVDQLLNSSYNKNTTVILFVGNSLGVRKRDLIHLFSSLEHKLYKLIICAFPYSNTLSEKQNKVIYRLNQLLYNMTCRQSDKIFCFDVNKFINNFKLTTDTLYLSNFYKKHLARLLAYNIYDPVIHSIMDNLHTMTMESPCGKDIGSPIFTHGTTQVTQSPALTRHFSQSLN